MDDQVGQVKRALSVVSAGSANGSLPSCDPASIPCPLGGEATDSLRTSPHASPSPSVDHSMEEALAELRGNIDDESRELFRHCTPSPSTTDAVSGAPPSYVPGTAKRAHLVGGAKVRSPKPVRCPAAPLLPPPPLLPRRSLVRPGRLLHLVLC